jgi:hypothetical protein
LLERVQASLTLHSLFAKIRPLRGIIKIVK